MKKVILFSLFLSIFFSHNCFAQSGSFQKVNNNDILICGGSLMISSKYVDKRTIKIIPNVELWYNRLFFKGFGWGIAYSFKTADPNARLTTGDKIYCYVHENSVFSGPFYNFNIKAFRISPFFNIGVCFSKFVFPVDTEPFSTYSTKTCTNFLISPGIRFGYELDRWLIFLLYNFNYYKCQVETPPYSTIATWSFPNAFSRHCLKIGFGFSF